MDGPDQVDMKIEVWAISFLPIGAEHIGQSLPKVVLVGVNGHTVGSWRSFWVTQINPIFSLKNPNSSFPLYIALHSASCYDN